MSMTHNPNKEDGGWEEDLLSDLKKRLPTKSFVGLNENQAETALALVDNCVKDMFRTLLAAQKKQAVEEYKAGLVGRMPKEKQKLGMVVQEFVPTKIYINGYNTARQEILDIITKP